MFVAIITVSLVFAARFGVANLQYYAARNQLEQWQEKQAVTSKASFDIANNAIDFAVSLHGSHPNYLMTRGLVTEWGVFSGELPTTYLENAKKVYLQSASLRPTWPLVWASLGMIKWRQEEFDSELFKYIINADRYGPYKPEVTYFLVELGLALYSTNHPFFFEFNDIVLERIEKGLSNTRTKPLITSIVSNYDQVKSVCMWFNSKEKFDVESYLNCGE